VKGLVVRVSNPPKGAVFSPGAGDKGLVADCRPAASSPTPAGAAPPSGTGKHVGVWGSPKTAWATVPLSASVASLLPAPLSEPAEDDNPLPTQLAQPADEPATGLVLEREPEEEYAGWETDSSVQPRSFEHKAADDWSAVEAEVDGDADILDENGKFELIGDDFPALSDAPHAERPVARGPLWQAPLLASLPSPISWVDEWAGADSGISPTFYTPAAAHSSSPAANRHLAPMGSMVSGEAPHAAALASFADDPGSRLWVGSLPASITESALKKAFSRFGVVRKVHLMDPRYPHTLYRAAFVNMIDAAAGAAAIEGLHDQKLSESDTRPIIVRVQKAREEPTRRTISAPLAPQATEELDADASSATPSKEAGGALMYDAGVELVCMEADAEPMAEEPVPPAALELELSAYEVAAEGGTDKYEGEYREWQAANEPLSQVAYEPRDPHLVPEASLRRASFAPGEAAIHASRGAAAPALVAEPAAAQAAAHQSGAARCQSGAPNMCAHASPSAGDEQAWDPSAGTPQEQLYQAFVKGWMACLDAMQAVQQQQQHALQSLLPPSTCMKTPTAEPHTSHPSAPPPPTFAAALTPSMSAAALVGCFPSLPPPGLVAPSRVPPDHSELLAAAAPPEHEPTSVNPPPSVDKAGRTAGQQLLKMLQPAVPSVEIVASGALSSAPEADETLDRRLLAARTQANSSAGSSDYGDQQLGFPSPLSQQILQCLAYIQKSPKQFNHKRVVPCYTQDQWEAAVPQLRSYGPLPAIVEMLCVAGSTGMELGNIGKRLSGDGYRVDLLKLKAYLTCFPQQFLVAPKARGYGSSNPTLVDQVWLIQEAHK